jgi:hypothetical protein
MKLDPKLKSLWQLLKAKAARVNRPLLDAEDDTMVFQVPSWETKLLESNRRPERRIRSGRFIS